MKFGTQSKKILSINGATVDSGWLYSTKLDGDKQYNGDINIYFQDEDKTLHITVILYEDMIENENTNMR